MARKKPDPEPTVIDEPEQTIFDETIDYLIVLDAYASQRSITGMEQGYGVMNKNTGVIELRFGTYAEALSGLMVLQDKYDEYMVLYKRKMGMLN